MRLIMNTTDNKDDFWFWLVPDFIARRIVPNRMMLYRLMSREVDPLPQPIVLNEGTRQKKQKLDSKTGEEKSNRYSGRRVAWRASEVEAWLNRQPKARGLDEK